MDFFNFVILFISAPDPNPILEPDQECIPIPVPLRQNVPISTGSGSGSTTLESTCLNVFEFVFVEDFLEERVRQIWSRIIGPKKYRSDVRTYFIWT